ncbi:hypothetical protein DL98DRAFT_533383 [Cadophora sp. DSE1049]|nr:hypothetical protein DL98DRAFT_533383 [Cadophora sp. DSE1049]
MKLPLLTVTTAVLTATGVLADSMQVWIYCYGGCTYDGRFHTAYGSFDVDAKDGCRGTSVTGMTEFCVDWPRKRGHFKFQNQDRRCMVQTVEEHGFDDPRCGVELDCWYAVMEERPCTWEWEIEL